MAFLSKFGNILRQTTSTHINTQLSASRPGIFQMFRCMSNSPSSKVFVGGASYFPFHCSNQMILLSLFFLGLLVIIAGVSFQTDDQSLEEAFSKYGKVIEGTLRWVYSWIQFTSVDEGDWRFLEMLASYYLHVMWNVNIF